MRRSFVAVTLALGLMVVGTALPLGVGAPVPEVPGLDKNTVLVVFHPGQVPADLAAFGAAHGATLKRAWTELGGGAFSVATPADGEAFLAALQAMPAVAAAEFDFAYQLHVNPTDPRWGSQWGPKTVKLPQAWDELADLGLPAFGDHRVRVAVLDTGADLDHEDLAANICGQRNFLDSGQPAEDDNDHGSHTAGIVAAVANNGKGIAGAAQACLYIGKVCNAGGTCTVSVVDDAVSWAINPDGDPSTDDKVHVISMSFGGAVGSSTMAAAMSLAWNNGILLVASAGNENCAPVGYPAAYAQVIAVGSLELAPAVGTVLNLVNGQTEVRAPYSNCGLALELSAPGSSILSTIRANDYASFSGTSMAAPLVAGVAALVKQANPALTNAQIRCVMDQTAHDYGAPKRDVEYGHGKVRADRAVLAAEDGATCVNYEYGIGIGGQNLLVTQTQPL